MNTNYRSKAAQPGPKPRTKPAQTGANRRSLAEGDQAIVLPDVAEAANVDRYHFQRAIKHAIALRRLGELAAAQGDLQLMVLVSDWALLEARKTLELVQREA